jgi:multiple sugar transport system substrate-binding protein
MRVRLGKPPDAMSSRVISAVALMFAVFVAAACGGGNKSGAVTLNFWSYNEPGGTFKDAADYCTKQSGGRYTIKFNALGNDPNTQRQSLVRRLAAGDSSIDLMSMDVIWTAEFAEAGWIKPFPKAEAAEIAKGTLQGPLRTATYKGRLYAAPANSNTQLLWYRKDLVKNPPKTWDDLISTASKMKKAGRIEIQGAPYEGTTVWFNSLVNSAGGKILSGPTTPALDQTAQKAADIMHRLAISPAADPSLSSQKEDQNRLAFEQGAAAFQVNYPFIYPSAKEGAPQIFKNLGWAPYPSVTAGGPNKAPIGGFNWGVGGATKHAPQAFAAAKCMRDERNQRNFAIKGGLPPTLSKIYDDKSFVKQYPFADIIRKQLEDAGVRPVSPAYADISLAIYTTLSPASKIKPDQVLGTLKDQVSKGLDSRALL